MRRPILHNCCWATGYHEVLASEVNTEYRGGLGCPGTNQKSWAVISTMGGFNIINMNIQCSLINIYVPNETKMLIKIIDKEINHLKWDSMLCSMNCRFSMLNTLNM